MRYGLTAILATDIEPATATQAFADERWRRALSDEFDAQTRNQSWDLVLRTLAPNLVGCKWVFKLKLLSNGSLDRFKARLVARGFHQ